MTNPEKSNQSAATVGAYMNREVKTIPVTATLQEVGKAFVANGVSTLLVLEDGRYVGIVSDKRLAREGIAKGLDPETTSVRAIMREEMLVIESDQPVRAAQTMMKEKGVRHLVVTEGGEIVGLVSISDLIRFYTDFFDG